MHLGCRDAEMLICREAVFDCFWWLSWTSVQTILQIDETSFLDAADFVVQVQHCRAIKIIFVFSIHTSLPCTPNININNNRNVSILASKVFLLMKFKYLNHPKQSGRQDVGKHLAKSLFKSQQNLDSNLEIRITDNTAFMPSMLP